MDLGCMDLGTLGSWHVDIIPSVMGGGFCF